MSRLRIGMDLDGVVYDWDTELRNIVKREFDITLAEAGHWDHYERQLKELGREDVWPWVWDKGVTECGLFLGNPYPGALDALDALAGLGDLVIITSRPKNARSDTFRWLAYEGIPTGEVHIGRKPKSLVDKCDLYVDDGPHNVQDLLDNTDGMVFLWDQPWNRTWNPERTYGRYQRVATWDYLVKRVARLSAGRPSEQVAA